MTRYEMARIELIFANLPSGIAQVGFRPLSRRLDERHSIHSRERTVGTHRSRTTASGYSRASALQGFGGAPAYV